MKTDLTDLLAQWPHDPHETSVRLLEGQDGRPILQIRLDLGVLQLEMTGRPDGQPSVLPKEAGDTLNAELAAAVAGEISQYDTRTRALMLLGEFGLAAQDADHMVSASRTLLESGHHEHTVALLAHSLTLRSRAMAEASLATQRPDLARMALDRGLEELEALLGVDALSSSNEAQLLNGMRDLLVPRLPASQRAELQERLRLALAAENYELAAILRDELRLMR